MESGEILVTNLNLYTNNVLSTNHDTFKVKGHKLIKSFYIRYTSFKNINVKINDALDVQEFTSLRNCYLSGGIKLFDEDTVFGLNFLFFDTLDKAKLICKKFIIPELLRKEKNKAELNRKEFHSSLTEIERLEKLLE